MEIANVGAAASAALADRQLLADNLDTFLQLLVTQLENQDPLEPMDTSEFTSQLVQYSSVEQQVKSNALLEKMVAAGTNSASQTAVGFIGKLVTADGATTLLQGGQANWALDAKADATAATFVIRNAAGTVVSTKTEPLDSGTSVFTWNGATSTGQPAPEGLYTLTVSARNAAGQTVAVSTQITGLVRGAEFDGGEPLLDIGGIKVKLSGISAVSLPPTG
jgi:flagellar basal-body rod modification protein FlgD